MNYIMTLAFHKAVHIVIHNAKHMNLCFFQTLKNVTLCVINRIINNILNYSLINDIVNGTKRQKDTIKRLIKKTGGMYWQINAGTVQPTAK